jgi:hypothetical protein
VAVVDETSSGAVETRLVIDPGSGNPLAVEIRELGPDGATELVNYQLVVGTGYTDETPPPIG